MRFMQGYRPADLGEIFALLVVGAILGKVFSAIGLPLPYFMGSLTITSTYAIFHVNRQQRIIKFPQFARKWAMAIIGVMIGSGFAPEVLQFLPSLWPSVGALVIFVVLLQWLGYLVFRRLGGYDRPTAYFAAMPGGLLEAVSMGEDAGANPSILVVQHFIRIALIVIIIPTSLYLLSGEPVGSSAGQGFGPQDFSILLGLQWLVLLAVGILFGRYTGLPAGHMMGPLILSCLVHATGLVSLTSPNWLLSMAQLVMGIGLGAMFTGVSGRTLSKAFGLGLVTVTIALAIVMLFVVILARFVDLSISTLFICYSPGGAPEMGLIALSLGINPVIVVLHHLIRILLTVGLSGVMYKWLHGQR